MALTIPFLKAHTQFCQEYEEQLPQNDPFIFSGQIIFKYFERLNCYNFRLIFMKLVKLHLLKLHSSF